MRRRSSFSSSSVDLAAVGAFFLVLAFVVGLAWVCVHLWRDYRRCIDNGGHFEQVNCRQVQDQTCQTFDFGGGSVHTVCYPTTRTECDSVCVGAAAETR